MSALIREMYGEMTPWGRFWLYLGLATLLAAAAMSVDFGWSVSVKHALFLGCLSIITAFAPDVAHQQWKDGHKNIAMAIAAICAPLFLIEFYSHAGYTAGLRGENISNASVQNTKYTDKRDGVAVAKETRALILAEKAKMLELKPWLPSVSAEGLKAQIEPLRLAVDLEAKRGGCKAICEKKMRELAALEEKVKDAEKAISLDKRLEAADRALAENQDKSEKTEFQTSAVAEQKIALAKGVAMIFNGSLTPTEFQEEGAQQTVNLAMALAGTGLPAFALFIAGLYRRPSRTRPDDEPDYGLDVAPTPPRVDAAAVNNAARALMVTQATPKAPAPVVYREIIKDEALAKRLRSAWHNSGLATA